MPTSFLAIRDLYDAAGAAAKASLDPAALATFDFAPLRAALARFEEPGVLATPEQIEAARFAYEEGVDERTTEIDDDALVSETDGGFWISASVFVANEDADDEESRAAQLAASTAEDDIEAHHRAMIAKHGR